MFYNTIYPKLIKIGGKYFQQFSY